MLPRKSLIACFFESWKLARYMDRWSLNTARNLLNMSYRALTETHLMSICISTFFEKSGKSLTTVIFTMVSIHFGAVPEDMDTGNLLKTVFFTMVSIIFHGVSERIDTGSLFKDVIFERALSILNPYAKRSCHRGFINPLPSPFATACVHQPFAKKRNIAYFI